VRALSPRPQNRTAGFHAVAPCSLLNDCHPQPVNAYLPPGFQRQSTRQRPDEAPAMLRIIRDPSDYTMAASPDDIAQAICDARPGRFFVEEVSRAGQLLPSGHSCRR
jgi:hypothetical protein